MGFLIKIIILRRRAGYEMIIIKKARRASLARWIYIISYPAKFQNHRKVRLMKPTHQSKTLFNFEFVIDSNIANISEENKSIK